MNQTKLDWNDTRILVPNFRNGDVFYVIYQQEIVAIRLDKSYIDLGSNAFQFDLKGVATSANNNDDLNGNVMFFIDSNDNNQIRVGFKRGDMFYWESVYNSVEDARNGIVSRKVIDIVNLPMYTKGYIKAYLSHGSYNTLDVISWKNFQNQPRQSKIDYRTMLFYNDGLVISNGTTPVMIAGYDTEEEVRKAIKARVSQYKVCTFEDEKKETPKEYTITITINSDMTAMDILKKIKKATEN